MATTATKRRGFAPGQGWSLAFGSDGRAAPEDPLEKRLSVTLSGVSPRFVSADGSFAIWAALRDTDEGEQAVTVKGALARCGAGEMLACEGRWVSHKQHGWSFQVERFSSALPKNARGVAMWLREKVPGVGPTFAQAIVDHFGAERVFEAIDEDPQRLREVRTKKGRAISSKQTEAAIAAWEDVRAIRQIEAFLYSYEGVTANMADKLYRRYGADVIEILQTDPYRITEMRGIGFLTADRIALSMGVPLDDPRRIQAGILFILDQAEGEGHTFMYLGELFKKVAGPRDAKRDREKGLGVSDKQAVAAAATELAHTGKLVPEEADVVSETGEMRKTQRVYSRRMHRMEKRLARHVRDLLATPSGSLFPQPERPAPPENATKEEIERLRLPSDEQWTVVDQVRNHRLSLLTGGPGSGKTTTQITVVDLAKKARKEVKLCAPTGKAARRMMELTGHPATTIHRLLEFSPADGGFTRDESNPIQADLIILDEASMLALDLADAFFRAVGPNTHVLLVGDPDQLPPVGAGKVLDDLINSGIVTRVHLNKVFRQAAQSMIITNARLINAGEMPFLKHDDAEQRLRRSMLQDFFFVARKRDKSLDPAQAGEKVNREIRDLVIDMACNRIPRTFKFDGEPVDPRTDIMVLAPMHNGPCGLEILNKELEARLNPGSGGKPKPAIVPNRGIAVGSRVVQGKNDYTNEIMNGELAIVLDYNEDDKEAKLSLDDGDREHWIPVADMETFHLAWAMSVHKSQGSEFPVVVAPVSLAHHLMLKRALVYTAVTRAKKLCVMVGETLAMRRAVATPEMVKRNSTLIERINDPQLSGELF